MSEATNKKKVKVVTVNLDLCNGCRACEVICSAFHTEPKYSINNPSRSRIRVIRDPLRDVFLPVFAGEYTAAECMTRDKYVINDREYDECDFCRASCPSRDAFKEPDSGLPIKCDGCEELEEGEEPWCVRWCLADALTYEEREEEAEEEIELQEMERGLEALADKFGLQQVLDGLARLNQKE